MDSNKRNQNRYNAALLKLNVRGITEAQIRTCVTAGVHGALDAMWHTPFDASELIDSDEVINEQVAALVAELAK